MGARSSLSHGLRAARSANSLTACNALDRSRCSPRAAQAHGAHPCAWEHIPRSSCSPSSRGVLIVLLIFLNRHVIRKGRTMQASRKRFLLLLVISILSAFPIALAQQANPGSSGSGPDL